MLSIDINLLHSSVTLRTAFGDLNSQQESCIAQIALYGVDEFAGYCVEDFLLLVKVYFIPVSVKPNCTRCRSFI